MSDQQNAITRKQDTPANALSRYLGARTKNLAQYAKNSIRPDTLVRLAVFEFANNESLQRCSPESVYSSLVTAAQLGLEPSGVRGLGYLVPYKGKCTFQPGWRGLIALALRSKAVKSIYAHVVLEGDEFAVTLGTSPKIHHVPAIGRGEDQRDVIAAYAVAVMADGTTDLEVMDRWELDKIRSIASQHSPAYSNWADQMFRKAPIRRLCKRLPLGDDYFLAAQLDELQESGKPLDAFENVIDVPSEEVKEEPTSRIQSAAAKRQQIETVSNT